MTTQLLPRRAALADWLRRPDPWSVAALAVVIVASLAYAWQARPVAPAARPAATLAPIILIATPVPTADTIAVQVAVLRLPRAVVAYDQPGPGGRVIGAVDSGRSYEIIARSGAEWLQLRIAESGEVWIQRAELEGPDLATPEPPAPTAAPIVVYVAPAAVATAAPQPTAAAAPAIRVGGCSQVEAAAKCSRTLPRR